MYKVYEVSFGDTLDSIMEKYNITQSELEKYKHSCSKYGLWYVYKIKCWTPSLCYWICFYLWFR